MCSTQEVDSVVGPRRSWPKLRQQFCCLRTESIGHRSGVCGAGEFTHCPESPCQCPSAYRCIGIRNHERLHAFAAHGLERRPEPPELLAHLPEDARVLTFREGDNFYGERERLWAYAVVARPAVWGSSVGEERQALQALRRLRITHILIDKVELAALPQGSVAIIGADFRRMWLALEYEDRHLELYRIRWENAQTAP